VSTPQPRVAPSAINRQAIVGPKATGALLDVARRSIAAPQQYAAPRPVIAHEWSPPATTEAMVRLSAGADAALLGTAGRASWASVAVKPKPNTARRKPTARRGAAALSSRVLVSIRYQSKGSVSLRIDDRGNPRVPLTPPRICTDSAALICCASKWRDIGARAGARAQRYLARPPIRAGGRSRAIHPIGPGPERSPSRKPGVGEGPPSGPRCHAGPGAGLLIGREVCLAGANQRSAGFCSTWKWRGAGRPVPSSLPVVTLNNTKETLRR